MLTKLLLEPHLIEVYGPRCGPVRGPGEQTSAPEQHFFSHQYADM